jgi:CPA1 family monovalent cation:H+ antiporter
MTLFQTIAVLISLAALFSYLNHRYLRLPQTIGVMVLGLATSLLLLAAGQFSPRIPLVAQKILAAIDFNQALMQGMLGFLLFAGALHLDLHDLRVHRRVILALATVGVLISTALVGGGIYGVLRLLNIPMPLVDCLVFGALISPTDPIAVLATLKAVHAPRDLHTQIAGESLLNDGVGVVVFLAVLGFSSLNPDHLTPATDAWPVLQLFLREAVGGALFGAVTGGACYLLLKRVDQYEVEILLSLALVTGGYALANHLHVSGPIAMVVAGLLIGNPGRAFAMSDKTREHLDLFWELVDDILNSILFLLIGLQVMMIAWHRAYLLAGLLAIVVVLAARLISVALPIAALQRVAAIPRHAVTLLTWGGLRGGISVALALSLRGSPHAPAPPHVDLITVMTYVVVVFSIGVQGLTIGPLLRRKGIAATAADA